MPNPKHKPLLALYAALLRLYPTRFHREFGREMLAAFSDMVDERGALVAWSLLLREFLLTLFREHFEDRSTLFLGVRSVLCALPPVAIYAAAVSHVQRVEEFVLSTFWLTCILAAFLNTGCRGRLCLVRTMAASVLGMLLPLALVSTYQPMIPGFFNLAAPLAVLAVTIGLILAVFARLMMEGIQLRVGT